MEIPFVKMSGSGNDFIIIDNRKGLVKADPADLAPLLCARRTAVGADGLVLLENDPEVDFAWRFHNSDGSEAEMCGNAARCAARLAKEWGMAPEELSFRTKAGLIKARVMGRRVRVELTTPFDLKPKMVLALDDKILEAGYINTGVPHVVIMVDDLEAVDLGETGPAVRYHQKFAPVGTNVNFVQVRGPGSLAVRTYERGVEAETLACGTGVAAAALVSSLRGLTKPPVEVEVRSGELLVLDFTPNEEGKDPWPGPVFFEGVTTKVYQGTLSPEVME
jgi:diaminopimelate epimerase